jgi:hypothetical protein
MVAHPRTPVRVDRLRALNAPEVASVELDANGQPRAVRRSQIKGGGQAVEAVIESWRIDDEWWRQPISRLYHDVMLEGGGHVVLFKDLVTGEWFAQQP